MDTGQRPRLSVLVISYRTRELTLECLRSLYRETPGLDFETIVLDNASDDGSADAVEAEFPQVRLVRSTENLGFAGGNNEAARLARGEYLLLLNPDTRVLDQAVLRLLRFAEERPDAGIWGGRTVFDDGSLNPGSCWAAPTPWSTTCAALGLARAFPGATLCNGEALGGWDRGTEREVDIVSGCFLLLRRETWDALQGFDPQFFMYGEDADLCLRARRAGHRPRITPAATIVHHGGKSERVRADKMVRLFTAKAQLFRRYLGPVRGRLALRALDLWALVRVCAFRVKRGRPESRAAWDDVWARRGTWAAAYRQTRRISS